MRFSEDFLKGYEAAIKDMKILEKQGIPDPGEIVYTLSQDLKDMKEQGLKNE